MSRLLNNNLDEEGIDHMQGYTANEEALRHLLEEKTAQYQQPYFIENDPISVPHLFSKKQDIEIAALFSALFAWGQRRTIIAKSRALMQLMDDAPHQFITQCKDSDLRRFEQFKHRTFNATDTLYCIAFLRHWYAHHDSLETAFSQHLRHGEQQQHIGAALSGFHDLFFSLPVISERTRKHIPTPLRQSSCKRLCMLLRWLVRSDQKGVDFGLWKAISPAQLLCPLDVHVLRVAERLGLLQSTKSNWHNALSLTATLRRFDAADPVKYDFALFGMGIEEKLKINTQSTRL